MKLLSELFSRRRIESRPTLEFAQSFSKALGDPHTAYPTVHVTGTNGKGSVCFKIAHVLENQGLKVGLFTSPHISAFSERISINGVEISDIEERLQRLLRLAPEAGFFELTTFLGLDYFREQKVDIAIVEVGIGGRLDPTNVITPQVSVITSVAFDHQKILGSTLEEIAHQKAGIIKPKVPVVLGPEADFQLIRSKAFSCHSPLHQVEHQHGYYDFENQAIAKKTLELFHCTNFEGIEKRPRCRFEVVGNVILDVAHNPAGFQKLIEAYDFHFPGEPFSAIIGMSQDKDVKKCLEFLAKRAKHLYLVEPRLAKPFSIVEMEQILRQSEYFHFTAGLTVSESLEEALSRQERTIVCGSFYIMQEANDVLRVQVGKKQSSLSRSESAPKTSDSSSIVMT
jgi:dihydrofolate synthase/folylpolyglutamate synthase